ncbi:hypothetical protein PBY51_001516 [Eleginops maclovinus]|uniref:Uncharacterized protein n=1 Tax=Eleginops maclovinus TaxID=56733 RepID=A0AAN8ACV7_ELEMC|nr:hypothetical protein PBY51_001516 [Eleginops maclovinus]
MSYAFISGWDRLILMGPELFREIPALVTTLTMQHLKPSTYIQAVCLVRHFHCTAVCVDPTYTPLYILCLIA